MNPTDMPMQTDGLDVFHTDNLNSVIAISNHQGKLRAQINYNSWGDIEKNSLLEQQPYFAPGLFTSRFREGISHLTHMDARWYNAETGRFIEPDLYNITALLLPQAIRSEVFEQVDNRLQTLLRDPQQQLRYSYVSNNPMRWVDPSGLRSSAGARLMALIKEAGDAIKKGKGVVDDMNDGLGNDILSKAMAKGREEAEAGREFTVDQMMDFIDALKSGPGHPMHPDHPKSRSKPKSAGKCNAA